MKKKCIFLLKMYIFIQNVNFSTLFYIFRFHVDAEYSQPIGIIRAKITYCTKLVNYDMRQGHLSQNKALLNIFKMYCSSFSLFQIKEKSGNRLMFPTIWVRLS